MLQIRNKNPNEKKKPKNENLSGFWLIFISTRWQETQDFRLQTND